MKAALIQVINAQRMLDKSYRQLCLWATEWRAFSPKAGRY